MGKTLFLDESGTHDLVNIDSQYPVFVLGGVIVDNTYLSMLDAEVQAFKQKMFGRTDIILHTKDISRNLKGFERLVDPSFRQRFYDGLNALMRSLDYKVIACAIKTDAHRAQYTEPADPYMYSLEILVERFCYDITAIGNGGKIIAEKRRPDLDRQLDLAWERLKVRGTDYCRGERIMQNISALESRPKSDNIAGLQLADLVVSPIGRYVIGKQIKEDFRIVESKFRKGDGGKYKGYGLVIRP